MQKALLLLFFLCSAQLAQSQIFEAGYLVLQRGDTLRGQVENAFWEEPPTVVRFRPMPTDRATTYSARQVQAVSLASGRRLLHERLPIDRYAETRLAYLTNTRVRKQQPDSVLADVLVMGPARLLGITLNETKHFFVQRPGQPYLEMAAHNYLAYQQGTHIVDDNNYKSQLQLYFGDCEAATKLAATASFNAADLARVVRAYNRQCAGGPADEPELPVADKAAQQSRIAVRAGIMGGVRYNSLLIGAEVPGVLAGLNLDGRLHAQGGLYVDLVAPGRRLALHTGLLVSRFGKSQPTAFSTTVSPVVSGSFEWQGTLTTGQLGLRGFLPVSTRGQLLVGGGYELNGFWGVITALTYNGVAQEPLLERFSATPLPYLEVGYVRERLAVVLSGRAYGASALSAVAGYSSPKYNIYYYYCDSLSLNATLSYRLNADSDALPK